MQVILLDKVPNVGNLGDIAKVKDGYARNFLIPTGRAAAQPPPTRLNLKPSAPSLKRLRPPSWPSRKPKAKSSPARPSS